MPHRDLVDPLERGDIGRFRRFPRQERRHYFLRDDLRVLDLCPDCAARALRLGEIRTLADCWIRPVRSYTHADQEVSAQLSARERMAANLLLTAA